MCDCAGVCLCLLGLSAVISYFTCNECVHYYRLENDSKDEFIEKY